VFPFVLLISATRGGQHKLLPIVDGIELATSRIFR
jgi:hypothetical protein